MSPIFTIGHSNRELSEFVELLLQNGVEIVVDVRKMPRSRSNPQFNGPELEKSLLEDRILYQHIEALTGFRKGIKTEVESAWENKSFQAYAAYMGTPEFSHGLEELRMIAREKVAAVMCSEAVWWRCHRRMIADALVARGDEVRHILSKSPPSPHELSRIAQRKDGRVIYPKIPDLHP